MRLSDIQPHYFPRLHYFARMLDSDVFVIRDDVQFVRNHRYPDGRRGVSHQAHAPIKGPEGPLLLGVSIKRGTRRPIHEIAVCYEQAWRRKHINQIKHHYGGAPGLERLLPEIEAILGHPFASLAELNVATICWGLAHLLGVSPRVPGDLTVDQANRWLAGAPCRLRRLELGSATAGESSACASERIVELCRRAGADEYLAGGTAIEAYLDPRSFRDAGVAITAQRWRCPEYPQQYAGLGYLPNLSVLDLLLNGSASGSRLWPAPSGAETQRSPSAMPSSA